jgi:pyruvate dehydrogenase E2 component (dihydrolipoamide acetyltransferase)
MASDVTMPRLSDSMEEGTILKWLVDEGGEVKRGEPLVEIETDKANMTYDADADGVLIDVVASEGDTLPVGEVIARIGEEGEAPGGGGEKEEEPEPEEEPQDSGDSGDGGGKAEEAVDKAERAKAKAEEAKEELGEPATATAEKRPDGGGDGDGRIKASPVARRMARDLGVELAELEGSGPGGRIVKADVEAASKGNGKPAKKKEREEEPGPEREAAQAGAKGQADVHELSRLQQTVSRRMAESKATAPDFALSLDVDMTACVELRERLKEVSDPAPSFNDMVVKAAAAGLREHPRVNGAYRDGKWELYEKVNVGVAVAAEEVLVVPTIFDADRKSLGEISRQARGLIEKVRDREIAPPEVSGGTFTVSNLGMYGIERFTAIINPPQAALLTVGSLEKKPAVDERGRVVARDAMTLTLVCDHRILYGADGAKFLARVRELLEQPLSLAL